MGSGPSWPLRFALWKGADWSIIRKGGRSGGRSQFSKMGQNKFKNGVYNSGQSLLNTCVSMRPTLIAKSRVPTTFLARGKSRLVQYLQCQVTSFEERRRAE